MATYSYVLYFHISHIPHDSEIIFLGSNKDKFELYFNVFMLGNIEPEHKKALSDWNTRVETALDIEKQKELRKSLSYAQNDYSYTIGKMTLHLKKMQSFD